VKAIITSKKREESTAVVYKRKADYREDLLQNVLKKRD
jgi:hypothetical protein